MSKQYGLAEQKKKSRKLTGLLICVGLMALLASVAATQFIAHAAGYGPALGRPLGVLDGITFYAPWSVYKWLPLLAPDLKINALKVLFITFIAPFAAFFLLSLKKKPKGIADLHGSARWATLDEIREMGLLEGVGVYIGGFFEKSKKMIHYLCHNGPEHIMGFAPTRSGKGVGPILMTLLSWCGSLLCLDIKGENWALSSGFRKFVLGQKTLRFDPADASCKGARFNPLREIRLDTYKAIPDIQNIAQQLIDPDGKGLENYWAEAGFAFMAGALAHVMVVRAGQGRSATLPDLAYALASEDGDISEFLDAMIETDHAAIIRGLYPDMPEQHGVDLHQFAASAGRDMKNKSDNERSGVLGTTISKLPLYRDPVVAQNISESDFSIDELMNGERPVSLYLVVSPADQARMKPLMRLIVSLIMSRRTEKMDFKDGRSVAGYKHRLLMLLDEFTSLGRLSSIEHAISYCAGYGIKLMIIIQDIVQLNEKYGKDNALMGNCHIRFAYAPNTIETAKLLSDLTGKTTILQNKESVSGSGGKQSKSKSLQETARPLLTPDETMRLPGLQKASDGSVTAPGDMLIFVAGQNPIYGKQILYFKDPVFSERAKIAPPEFSDRNDRQAGQETEPQAAALAARHIQHGTFEDFLQ